MFGRGGRGGGGGGGRQVCHFFLEGRCKFGNNCKNEHPTGQDNSQSQGGFGNRFAALNNNDQGGARNPSGAFGSSSTPNQDQNPYNVTGETIKLDLTSERPIWPLSSYGPGKNAPLQLMEGDIEQSPEEMRVRHYLAVAKGNPQESAQLEAQTAAKANEAIQRILADINGAVKYIIDGKDQHPNRLDMENKGSGAPPAQQQNAFGAPAAATAPATSASGAPAAASGFGQPSGMGQQNPAFGKPAFGQPAAQSTFGQASAFGKPSQPGFGQASAMGGSGSAFGQPSQPAQGSAFGQSSAMGSGGGGASAFGQPSAPGQSTGFGQPSQIGQKPAFGQSTFGQTSQPAFGQASKPAFGQASAAGQTQGTASPFAAAATQSSGFAQAAQQPSTGFGQPSAFGAAAGKSSPFATAAGGQSQQPASPFATASNNAPQQQQQQQQASPFSTSSQSAFGQPSQPTAPQSPFGTAASNNASKPAFGQPTQPTTSAFGQPAQQPPAQQQQQPQQQQQQQQQPQQRPLNQASATPDPATYLSLNASNQPTSFKNNRVTYLPEPKNYYVYRTTNNNNIDSEERLWFPTGPPVANADIQLEDAFYEGALGQQLQDIYAAVASQGMFGEGRMPECPPKREWVRFDI